MQHVEMFENRLAKRYRHLKKWAKREEITCYRLYDRDIPEFPFCIDLYGNKVYFAEFERANARTDAEQAEWLQQCVLACSRVLDLQPQDVYLRQRQQQKGSQQYERISDRQSRLIVEENGLRLMVNLTDYLDTGLFLDHRITRGMVAAEAQNRHFLNLFAYTGSFTVYAAAGGAASTLTLDMSAIYLQWAQDNMRLNGFIQQTHRYTQADVLQWINQPPPKLPPFGLVVLDPPTFSNSKRMKGIFDVQRNHAALIGKVLQLMEKNGVLYFSTNYRRFKPDFSLLRAAQIDDITAKTLPEDFKQGKPPHVCFRLVK